MPSNSPWIRLCWLWRLPLILGLPLTTGEPANARLQSFQGGFEGVIE